MSQKGIYIYIFIYIAFITSSNRRVWVNTDDDNADDRYHREDGDAPPDRRVRRVALVAVRRERHEHKPAREQGVG